MIRDLCKLSVIYYTLMTALSLITLTWLRHLPEKSIVYYIFGVVAQGSYMLKIYPVYMTIMDVEKESSRLLMAGLMFLSAVCIIMSNVAADYTKEVAVFMFNFGLALDGFAFLKAKKELDEEI